MKKVLLVHFGSWFSKQCEESYQQQIDILTDLLQTTGISIQRLHHLPTASEIEDHDAIIFISLSFKDDAIEMQGKTEKYVFMITGLPGADYDEHGVIALDKSYGYHKNVEIISEIISNNPKYIIRTAPGSIAGRGHTMNWHAMDNSMELTFEKFLTEKPLRKKELERGGIVTINQCHGYHTQNVRLTRLLKK